MALIVFSLELGLHLFDGLHHLVTFHQLMSEHTTRVELRVRVVEVPSTEAHKI